LWAVVRLGGRERARAWDYALATALGALAFAVKETFALLYPALALGLWWAWGENRRWRDLWVLAAMPLVDFAGYGLLAGGGATFLATMRLVGANAGAEYALRYQSGPPHRLLLDLALLSPLVLALATGAMVAGEGGGRRIGWLALAALVPFCLSPSK